MLKQNNHPNPGLRAYLWLIAGLLLTTISNGLLATPIGSWLGLVCLVHFYRSQRRLSAVFLTAGIFILANTLSFWSSLTVPVWLKLGIFIFYLVIMSLPFFVDYFFYRRLEGFVKTLGLPLTIVILEFALTRLSPYAASGAFAYTQFDNYPLLQLASLTGMWGISFLLYWFFSVIPLLLEKDFTLKKYRSGLLCFAIFYGLVFGYGSLRLRFSRPQAPTVRVAALTIERRDNDALRQALNLTEREALAGAKIIFWQEAALLLSTQEQAEDAIAKAAALAKACKIYLFPAIVIQSAPGQPGINKVVAIDPEGIIRFEYLKSHEIPGGLSLEGPADLPLLETPYGTLSTAICYDADFPQFIRQTSLKGIDILLVPSSDWQGIDPYHTQMIALRAVENGINLVRQSYACTSQAFDHLGRSIASLDYFRTTDRVLVTHLSTVRVPTFYGLTGDWFPWVCLAGMGWLLFLVIRKHRLHKG